MLIELEKIYADFESSVNRVASFIENYTEIRALDFQYMRRSKYYKAAQGRIEKIQAQFAETQSVKYNAVIISLYGCYELTIKQATKEVIRYMLINKIGEVDELNNENLAAVIKNIDRSGLDRKISLINGLYLLFKQNDVSGYNFDLSLNTFQNLKTGIVCSIAKVVGIHDLDQQLKSHPAVIEYVKDEKGFPNLEKAMQYIKSGVSIFEEIDALVDSRNKIAHEGYDSLMIADSIILNNLIPKLKLYVSTYLWILQLHILKFYEEKEGYFSNFDLIKPVINKNVICFNTGDNSVNKNNLVLITTDKNKIFAKIVNLQINGSNVDAAPKNTCIGCQLDICVKDSYKFKLFLGEK